MIRGMAFGLFTLALLAGRSRGQGVPEKDVKPLVDKAMTFLKATQGEDGSFSPKIAGPGVSALVAVGLIKNGVSPDDPLVAKALKYVEGTVQPDGSVTTKFLANYTTSVAVMAFAEGNKSGKYDTVIKNAEKYLRSIQHGGKENEPTHGGFSYDGKKYPDTSNTGFSIDALIAAGIPKDDPALKKAIVFLSRSQNLPGESNPSDWAKAATPDDKGGFVYNTSGGKDGKKAPIGGLRSAGSMTYTGLKSFLYAGVDKKDPRVQAAVDWVRRHYSLDENPGMGKSGLYYYYQTFGKAMNALGEDTFKDDKGKSHDWRRELFDALAKRQLPDGSWQNAGDRFGEDDKNLATAFALISLSYCRAK